MKKKNKPIDHYRKAIDAYLRELDRYRRGSHKRSSDSSANRSAPKSSDKRSAISRVVSLSR